MSKIPLPSSDISSTDTVTITGQTINSLKVQEYTPLDVSGATVSVQEDTPLDASGATVSVQEDTPLDASAAPVSTEPPNYAGGVGGFSQNISASTSLNALPVPSGTELLVKSDSNNDDDILLGGFFPLEVGESLPLPADDAGQITVDVASGTQTIHVIAINEV